MRDLFLQIFVHLRDSAGATVAQADFVPLEGATVTLKQWVEREEAGDTLRTGTVLWLPQLPPDDYSLWVGLYEPFTFERLPVTNDQSGENAITIGQVTVEN